MSKQTRKQQGAKRSEKKQDGGKKKTRKMAKGPSEWNKKVMAIYRDMKKKDPSVKLGAAMKEASRRKKRGDL